MNVDGKHYRTIWPKPGNDRVIQIIDQALLPHRFAIRDLAELEDFRLAIADMHVRGAGLIGATAGYGMYVAALEAAADHTPDSSSKRSCDWSARAADSLNGTQRFKLDVSLEKSARVLTSTRPTASNLAWAVDRQLAAMARENTPQGKVAAARRTAAEIADEDAESCRRIGQFGLHLIAEIADRKAGEPVNILTHCNAGWLAFVDYGSATAPIYAAHEAGIPVHVWVDETRPRNQGAALTAWELAHHGVPHRLVVDNAGGHLMQHGLVDLVLVGTDRTTRRGDVANKIGTYLKALAAADNGIPFYVALPSSTFDFSMLDGLAEIPIEQRDEDEVIWVTGRSENGSITRVRICPQQTSAANFGFDVTPAHLVSGLITERGICKASEQSIASLFPDLTAN